MKLFKIALLIIFVILAEASQESISKIALEWEKRAQKGDVEAMKITAAFYEKGAGFKKDIKKAFYYYKKAAMKGDVEAAVKVGLMYLEGEGVEKDEKLAIKWLSHKNSENFHSKPERKNEDIQTMFHTLIKKYEDNTTKSVLKRVFSEKLGIIPYKENYFMPFTYDFTKKSDRNRKEAKFQISFLKPLASNLLGYDEIYAFGYTQQSNWQIYSASSPFRETNYEPELFVMVPTPGMKRIPMIGYKVGFNHQSNGQPVQFSRSWNRIFAEGLFHYKNLLYAVKVWYRIPERDKRFPGDPGGDDNPDIESYLGYGEFKAGIPLGRHFLKLKLRNNLRFKNNRGSVQLDWSFPFFLFKRTFGYVQYFNGYGESLIDYNKNVNKIGFGMMFTR
ncbi:phospholipase A [Nitrosophilus alvini]|uniref:phospholipase A n=1 Tax=Nitrosophilus alvini TaxID=2714855 RepID=UPI001909609B|nr:phospholipase A [Nitrosophilus alvini]